MIYIIVAVNVQFDYWEVRPNELLHHHGVLSDLKRLSAPNLRIDKEINDLFEYLLLRSGRLILHASSEKRAIVLENVFFINKKEQQLTKMLVRFKSRSARTMAPNPSSVSRSQGNVLDFLLEHVARSWLPGYPLTLTKSVSRTASHSPASAEAGPFSSSLEETPRNSCRLDRPAHGIQCSLCRNLFHQEWFF